VAGDARSSESPVGAILDEGLSLGQCPTWATCSSCFEYLRSVQRVHASAQAWFLPYGVSYARCHVVSQEWGNGVSDLCLN
jgi:hypothetical protein